MDRALRGIAQRRAGLDAEEMHWLREAEALQIWRPLGMVSALDYMERALGYAPRTAHDRLRVARALGGLPQLTAALSQGELPFSAVRELTRVATAATEREWLAHAKGKNLRQIDDPPKPYKGTKLNDGRYLELRDGLVCLGQGPTPDEPACEDTCEGEVCISATEGIVALGGNWAPDMFDYAQAKAKPKPKP